MTVKEMGPAFGTSRRPFSKERPVQPPPRTRSGRWLALIPKKPSSPIALASRCFGGRIGFDQPIVTQHRNPGIPVSAGRLFAEGLRQFSGIAAAPPV